MSYDDIIKEIDKECKRLMFNNVILFIMTLSLLVIIGILVYFYIPMFCQYGTIDYRCMYEDEFYYLKGL